MSELHAGEIDAGTVYLWDEDEGHIIAYVLAEDVGEAACEANAAKLVAGWNLVESGAAAEAVRVLLGFEGGLTASLEGLTCDAGWPDAAAPCEHCRLTEELAQVRRVVALFPAKETT